jgi:hypothetical protein
MASGKTVRVAFYETKLADAANRSLHEILQVIQALPLGQSRTVLHRDQTLHLKEISFRDEGYWIGDVSKIRLDERMVLSDIAGAEVELDSGERGPCDKTAFLYYPPSLDFHAREMG